jgi:hypothetical protein
LNRFVLSGGDGSNFNIDFAFFGNMEYRFTADVVECGSDIRLRAEDTA